MASATESLYSKNDLSLFDNLKAISIFLICLHHFHSVYTLPFISVMMPTFAFLSGYSAKNVNLSLYVKNIFPLWIFMNVSFLPLAFLSIIRNSEISINNFFYIFPWYFIGLIVWLLFVRAFDKIKYPFVFSLIVSIVLFYYLRINIANCSPMHGILFIIEYCPLFAAGYYTSWNFVVAIRRWAYRYILIVPLVFIGYCYFGGFLIAANKNIYFENFDLILNLSAALITVYCMLAVFPGKYIKYLTKIGQFSLYIYMLHPIIVIPTKFVAVEAGLHPNLIFYVLFSVAICIILSSNKVSNITYNTVKRIRNFIFNT